MSMWTVCINLKTIPVYSSNKEHTGKSDGSLYKSGLAGSKEGYKQKADVSIVSKQSRELMAYVIS